jgi:hypothetical protein
MAYSIPGLAADDVAKLLTTNVKRPDGKDAPAFNSQAGALKAMRTYVLELDKRVAQLEAVRPFP